MTTVTRNPAALPLIREAVADGLQVLGDAIAADAKHGAPMRTGALRESISAAVDVDSDDPEVVVGTDSGYGGYVELGTRNMRARPFLVPAVLRHRRDGGDLIAAGARRRLGQ